MSKDNGRVAVWLEPERKRFRWYAPNGSRKARLIPNYDSLSSGQIENLRQALELTLNNGSVDPFSGVVLTTTMTLAACGASLDS